MTGNAHFGFRNGNEEEFICDMSEEYPNIIGGFFDEDYLSK